MKEELKPVMDAIDRNKAKLLGEGPWVKDAAFRVYEFEGKYYSIIVYNWQNMDLMDDTLEEITKDKINSFIDWDGPEEPKEKFVQISESDASFLLDVIDQDWVNCCMKLTDKSIGDIDKAQTIERGKRDIEIMNKLKANGIY
jgi:hypothetical protein